LKYGTYSPEHEKKATKYLLRGAKKEEEISTDMVLLLFETANKMSVPDS